MTMLQYCVFIVLHITIYGIYWRGANEPTIPVDLKFVNVFIDFSTLCNRSFSFSAYLSESARRGQWSHTHTYTISMKHFNSLLVFDYVRLIDGVVISVSKKSDKKRPNIYFSPVYIMNYARIVLFFGKTFFIVVNNPFESTRWFEIHTRNERKKSNKCLCQNREFNGFVDLGRTTLFSKDMLTAKCKHSICWV